MVVFAIVGKVVVILERFKSIKMVRSLIFSLLPIFKLN